MVGLAGWLAFLTVVFSMGLRWLFFSFLLSLSFEVM
jgi:hypothetical protein